MSEVLVNVDVPDLEAGMAFYEDGLGFRFGKRLGDTIAEMQSENCRVYLLAKAAGSNAVPGASAPRDYARHWTPVHLDLSVEDIGPAVAKACGSGATLESGPDSHAWGTIAKLADPFGNGFCLIQFTAAGYDAIESLLEADDPS